MNLYTELSGKIKTALEDPALATIASVTASEWSNNHVFNSIGGYIKDKNRGRLPFIEFARDTSDYQVQGTSGTAATRGGTVTSNWRFIVHVAVTSGSEENTNEIVGFKLAELGISKIRSTNINLLVGSESITQLVPSPFAYAVEVRFTVENSWDESLRSA